MTIRPRKKTDDISSVLSENTSNAEAEAISQYTLVKNSVDESFERYNKILGININQIIDDAYSEYENLIDKNIVNPDFVKTVLVNLGAFESGNASAINAAAFSEVIQLISANDLKAFDSNGAKDAKQNITACMIYLSKIAKENGYGADKLEDLFVHYGLESTIHSGTITGQQCSDLFKAGYYPNLSKETP